ncbi:MAG: hypothetical protein HOK63_01690 [Thaumarchaeota archaeon]|jgi:hypothetical protein|nr:hypothetical protein [Nitrososphaerota archaeon]MBT5842099.1 hypothetical protein [Nitrososphaerota archaeon]MBT6468354.1 hypothetical protein [Nitrososphaerota archaeon]
MNNKNKFCTEGLYALPVFVMAVGLFVVIWAGIWFKKSRMTNRVQKYTILIYDANNQQITPDGLRTDFRNNDVAWSFMKEYKILFPFYTFALLSEDSHHKTLIKFL